MCILWVVKCANRSKLRPRRPLLSICYLLSILSYLILRFGQPMIALQTLEMGEDDILVPFSTQDDEGKYTVWDMIEMMRAGELYYSDDEESEETEE